MQSYPLNLAPGQAQQPFMVAAIRFVYESGLPTPADADARIVVKPDSGSEIVLRPGQSFALPQGQAASMWYVRANDPTVAINGNVIIGSGEFDDNSLKVDSGSGAITVIPQGGFTVVNDEAHRVPVDLDAETKAILQEYPVMKYNTVFKNKSSPTAGVAQQLWTAAENQNGIIIEKPMISGWETPLLVKDTAPTSDTDGVVISTGISSDINSTSAKEWKRFLIPAGKSLWIRPTSTTTGGFFQLLCTVL